MATRNKVAALLLCVLFLAAIVSAEVCVASFFVRVPSRPVSYMYFTFVSLCLRRSSQSTLKIIDANGIDDDDGQQLDKGGADGHHKHKVN